MRPMGEWLAQQGISSVGPRLAGHGTTWEDLDSTTWQDWERDADQALADIGSRCSDVIVVGLSMGGAMSLHLAAKHPDRLRGISVINPDVRRPQLALAPVLRLFTKTIRGVGNDIKKAGQDEVVYDRTPLRAAAQLGKLYKTVQGELPSMKLPLLVFSSDVDHIVKPSNSRFVMANAGSARKDLVPLRNSYHVATLDYDADQIFERILAFARSLSTNAPAQPA
jgi:carboxylesterase